MRDGGRDLFVKEQAHPSASDARLPFAESSLRFLGFGRLLRDLTVDLGSMVAVVPERRVDVRNRDDEILRDLLGGSAIGRQLRDAHHPDAWKPCEHRVPPPAAVDQYHERVTDHPDAVIEELLREGSNRETPLRRLALELATQLVVDTQGERPRAHQ